MFTNNQIDVSSLPKVEHLEMRPIHRNYLYVLFINIFLVYGSIILGLVVIRTFSDDDSLNQFAFYAVCGLAVISLFTSILYYLGFKKRKYAMREKDITYSHGYLITKTITLPHNRIQHLEIARSFLARKLGLSTLKIYSAGESGGDIAIKGLPKGVAEAQYAFLTKVINERL